jgi:hypothetical protein
MDRTDGYTALSFCRQRLILDQLKPCSRLIDETRKIPRA